MYSNLILKVINTFRFGSAFYFNVPFCLCLQLDLLLLMSRSLFNSHSHEQSLAPIHSVRCIASASMETKGTCLHLNQSLLLFNEKGCEKWPNNAAHKSTKRILNHLKLTMIPSEMPSKHSTYMQMC